MSDRRATFYYDVSSPYAYLAAQRLDHARGERPGSETGGGRARAKGEFFQELAAAHFSYLCKVRLTSSRSASRASSGQTISASPASDMASETG